MIVLLIGIVIAALLFAAFLWSIYRAVTAKGLWRWNALALSILTIIAMAGASRGSGPLMMIAGLGCVISGVIAVIGDERWSKLLPTVQVALGLFLIYLVQTTTA